MRKRIPNITDKVIYVNIISPLSQTDKIKYEFSFAFDEKN